MAQNRELEVSSLLMAALFAVSAGFQFNDPDWYFWIPLYATASIVNLVDVIAKTKNSSILTMRKMCKFGFWVGVFLFVKVTVEDCFLQRIAVGFWSLDMHERVVRERFGSGLVICSMFLHLEKYTPKSNYHTQLQKYGMLILVSSAYGLSLFFFVFQYDEMRY